MRQNKDIIIKGIVDNHLYCCGKDLGEIRKEEALFCDVCKHLYFTNPQREKKITDFLKSDVEK